MFNLNKVVNVGNIGDFLRGTEFLYFFFPSFMGFTITYPWWKVRNRCICDNKKITYCHSHVNQNLALRRQWLNEQLNEVANVVFQVQDVLTNEVSTTSVWQNSQTWTLFMTLDKWKSGTKFKYKKIWPVTAARRIKKCFFINTEENTS